MVETFVRRDIPGIRSEIEADLKKQIRHFAEDNASTVLEYLPAEIIEFDNCLDVIAARYRSQLPEDADPRDWYVMRMEAKTVARP